MLTKLKFLLVVLIHFVLISNPLCGQNTPLNNGAVGIGLVGGAIALSEANAQQLEALNKVIEQRALAWFIQNHEMENTTVYVRCLSLEGNKWNDLSSTNSVVVEFRQYPLGKKPVLTYVVFILSNGWWNEYGTQFSKFVPIVIDKTQNASDFLIGTLQLLGEGNITPISKDSILNVKNTFDGKEVRSTTTSYFSLSDIRYPFTWKNGFTVASKTEEGDFLELQLVPKSEQGYRVCESTSKRYLFVLNNSQMGIFIDETGDIVYLKNSLLEKILGSFFPYSQLN